MSLDYRLDIARISAQMRPASILVLGNDCALFNDYVHSSPHSRLVCVSHGDYLASVDALGRMDLAYLSGVIENMEKKQAGYLLSRLRDLHAQRVIVTVRIGEHSNQKSCWKENELRALGLYRIGRYPNSDTEIQVFTFDLHDYKPTPDWLNSKDWAHPEIYDKYWW